MVLLALSLSLAPHGHTTEAPSFPALLAQGQSNAPLLLEQAANVRAANADARQARAWTNPTLNATAENIGAPLSGGVSQRQDTYTLTQVFEIGGKRTARIEAEERKSVATAARGRQASLAFAGELAIAYATAEAMQQRQALAEAELSRAQDDLRAAQALVIAGREAELRSAQARASTAAARAALASAAADAAEALERLAALAGARETFTSIVHPFLGTVQAQAAGIIAAQEEAPAFAAALAERDAANALVRLEEKKWIPDIGVSVGLRKFAWSSDSAKTVGITASMPLFDRNGSGAEAARERATGAAMRADAARLESAAQRRTAASQVLASDKRLQAAEEGEAAASEAYRLGRIGYDAGKTPLSELLAIRRALAEAKSLSIETRLARIRALAALSLAEGRPVFGEIK